MGHKIIDGWKTERIDGLPNRNRLLRTIEYCLMGKTDPIYVTILLSRVNNERTEYLTIKAFDNFDNNPLPLGRIPEETLVITSTGPEVNNNLIIKILKCHGVDGHHSTYNINGYGINQI